MEPVCAIHGLWWKYSTNHRNVHHGLFHVKPAPTASATPFSLPAALLPAAGTTCEKADTDIEHSLAAAKLIT
jgi:hypothetical protein